MGNEAEIIKITRDIQEKVKAAVDKNQKEYILREQLKVIREELGDSGSATDADDFEEKLKHLKAEPSVKEKIKKEIQRFRAAGNFSSESGMIRSYIETVLEMPWDKMGKDNEDIRRAEKVLREEHYGLLKVKERIIEYLAVRLLTKKGDAPILCLVGPPGTGKTSVARSVARALDKAYVRISLGGVHEKLKFEATERLISVRNAGTHCQCPASG